MYRRRFLTTAGFGVAAASATTIAAPAVLRAQPPEIKWRCASSFPKNLDVLFGTADEIAKRVAAATDNKFQIRVFAGGEIVPGLQVLDAVQNETVECGHTASYYYVGKDPTFAFDTAIPFGLNCRAQNAWMYSGGGTRADARVLQGLQHRAVSGRRHRRSDGRLVSQGDQDPRGSARAQVPDRRLRGSTAGTTGGGAAADRRRRPLSGAREGHHRRGRVRRSVRRREAGIGQGRALLLLSRVLGAGRATFFLRQHQAVGVAAEANIGRRSTARVPPQIS